VLRIWPLVTFRVANSHVLAYRLLRDRLQADTGQSGYVIRDAPHLCEGYRNRERLMNFSRKLE